MYVYYTATTPTVHNRISRFTANGDVAVAGSEVVILELDRPGSATNHNGGALAFGPDGKLYAAVGENGDRRERAVADEPAREDASPQQGRLDSRRQSVLQLDDRQQPRDLGARPAQPVHVRVQPRPARRCSSTTSGQNTWEEINDGIAGANYGWPTTKGRRPIHSSTAPRYAYNHSSRRTCAITGGAFYSPLTARFPADYFGDYFFADYCGGWIRKLDPRPATRS